MNSEASEDLKSPHWPNNVKAVVLTEGTLEAKPEELFMCIESICLR
jgi:hypothetical protein